MRLAPIARLYASSVALRDMLGPLRAEILAALWKLGRATVREVQEHLPASRREVYATIRAAMQRLVGDGYLARLPIKKRNAHLYMASVSAEALTRQLLHQILDGLAADFPGAVADYIARCDAARAPQLRLVWRADRQQRAGFGGQ
ncbi:MAG TPA: BlaI/MecI/CopY family transcriptional regulator [Roseiflexaceae bacterium]|nr:BlaI/MecI/CopY family transcriptional regulator [Roseiflexaceae bacterium]